ncbi:MAG: hypothetical protein ACMUIU_13200 [bacterium]
MTTQNNHKSEFSSYMDYLPAIFHETLEHDPFLGHFLKIFERIWSGYPYENSGQKEDPGLSGNFHPPLEETIDHIWCFFNPRTVPVKYLLSLGSWLNLDLNSYPAVIYPWIGDWHQEILQKGISSSEDSRAKEGKLRLLLRRTAPLLLGKGTLAGLLFALNRAIAEYLKIDPGLVDMKYTRGAPKYQERNKKAKVGVEIVENFAPTFAIGIESTIGLDTQIIDTNIEAENTFTIYLTSDDLVDEEKVRFILSFIVEIVEEVKPAHTWMSVVRWRKDNFSVINYPES